MYFFTGGNDGANPRAGLVQGSDGNFYGTTEGGGTNGAGTLFKINTNGALTSLYSFTGGDDGANPTAGLVQASDGNFYGTASAGAFFGTLFRVTTNGSFSVIYSFTGADDGAYPEAVLIQANDGYFYGTASSGGISGLGTVFRVSLDGAFTSLFSFNDIDGATPAAALLQAADGYLYGTTTSGTGRTSYGTVFRISTNGTFNPLYLFTGGNDGSEPNASLIQANDGSLYGTTTDGGTNGAGTVFQLSTNGTLASLYSFTGGNDGAYPYAGLVLVSDGNFYGTTEQGGTGGAGTVFQIGANGALTSLYSFLGSANDGAYPLAALVQGSHGNFYGTTSGGGTSIPNVPYGGGTVFQISTNGALTSLYSFTGGNDGWSPRAALVQGNDGYFYGTTSFGTVFQISTNGVLTTLYSFTGGYENNPIGEEPCGLVQGSDGYLYGATTFGGTNNLGTVFQISTNGAYTTLYSFTGGNNGAYPLVGLAQGSDGNFYGTTVAGGANGGGIVFQMSTNGALTILYSFTGGNDGSWPNGLVQGSDGSFYGTTYGGGQGGVGTVFRIAIVPDTLQISPAQGFASTGPFGGPFSVTELSCTLTNISAATLNWSLVSTSPWLNASSRGGMIGPGAAVGVTFSLNAAAYHLAPGSYAATVVFNDLEDGSVQSLQFTLQTTDALQITGYSSSIGAQLQVAGRYGQICSIQTCTNLLPPIDWVTLTNFTITANVQPFLDTAAGNDSQRFYRALLFVNTNCVPPPAGLVSWWPADGNALDIVGGNNGILEGGVTYTNGEVGGAFNFDGATGFVSTSTLITNPQTFTLSLWFSTDTTNGGVLISFDNTQFEVDFGVSLYDRNIYMDDTGALHFGIWSGNPSPEQINSAPGYNDNNWHYAAGSLSPSTGLSFYLDGVLVGNNPSATNDVETFNGYWRIGDDDLNNWPFQPSSYYFQGQIDAVAIFNVPLSPAEVYAIYAAGSAGMCNSP